MGLLATKYVVDIASEVLRAFRAGQQIPLISHRYPALTSHNAYQVTRTVHDLRIAAGERLAGRKIGFTNRNIWKEYAVSNSNWGYMYNTTVQALPVDKTQTVSSALFLDKFLAPRIEPDIVFRISSVPNAAMTDQELIKCIDGVAHGFELFISADTTAADALHRCLLLGPWHEVRFDGSDTRMGEAWQKELTEFDVDLYQGDQSVDSGKGINVLGSPLHALKRLVELLDEDSWNGTLEPGQIVTTGTLTKAQPVHQGESWWTRLRGLPGVEGIETRFE